MKRAEYPARQARSAPAWTASGRHEAAGNPSIRRPVVLGGVEEHLGYHIRRLQVWIFQDLIRTMAAIDLRPAQFSILGVIGENPGVSQSDVAAALGIERARLVRLLDRLEKRGLTCRMPAIRDRRSHALHLTPEGRTLLEEARTLADEHETRLAARLGPELHAMLLKSLRECEP